jgi:S1-C subfamily serine protease
VSVSTYSAKSYPKPEQEIKRAEVVARDKDADVALVRLELRAMVPAAVPVCPAKLVPTEAGFAALIAGCGPGHPTCNEEVVRARVRARRPDDNAALLMWQIDERPPKGHSGGPLIDTRGNVVGICSGRNGAKGYYVHADEIHAVLRRHGFRWLFEDGKK